MKRLRILKLSLALCLLIENCIFAVNGVNISTYFLLLFYGLVRTEILFLRVKWKKLTFFEKFEKDVILLNIKETFFVDYFFESLILCGYVSFSQYREITRVKILILLTCTCLSWLFQFLPT